MSDLNCATADPLFYLHHSFVDCVFQEFFNSSPSDPSSYLSNARGGFHHQSWAAMTPYLGIKNGVVLDASRYQHYTYKPKPSSSTCKKNSDCGNKYALWCDTRLDPAKCRVKVKTGGTCNNTGLPVSMTAMPQTSSHMSGQYLFVYPEQSVNSSCESKVKQITSYMD